MANTNPQHCNRPMRRNGKTNAGHQRYRCSECGYSETDGNSGHGGHRHGIEGGTPKAELMRRLRAKRKSSS